MFFVNHLYIRSYGHKVTKSVLIKTKCVKLFYKIGKTQPTTQFWSGSFTTITSRFKMTYFEVLTGCLSINNLQVSWINLNTSLAIFFFAGINI